ncbi:hypothetical protein Droror1_Dr00013053 [Drosera rotundifolia]
MSYILLLKYPRAPNYGHFLAYSPLEISINDLVSSPFFLPIPSSYLPIRSSYFTNRPMRNVRVHCLCEHLETISSASVGSIVGHNSYFPQNALTRPLKSQLNP